MKIQINEIFLVLLLIAFILWIYFSIINNIRYQLCREPYKKAEKMAKIFMLIFIFLFIIGLLLFFIFKDSFPVIHINLNFFSKITL